MVHFEEPGSAYRISFRAQPIERRNEEPRSFIPGRIKVYFHSILLYYSWYMLVDCQKLITLQVQKLREKIILGVIQC